MRNRSSDVIFRRFRRGKNGKVYDAFKYGLKGWPIRLRPKPASV